MIWSTDKRKVIVEQRILPDVGDWCGDTQGSDDHVDVPATQSRQKVVIRAIVDFDGHARAKAAKLGQNLRQKGGS